MDRAVVVGAGVFGSWSAWRLAQDGYRVTLIDAYGPANGRASSADHSRVIRSGYGADAIYSRSATASWRDWEWLSRETGQQLLTRTGALFMGEPGNAYIDASRRTLETLSLTVDSLDPSSLSARFPQISSDGLGRALLEHDAGVIRARAAVQALVRVAVANGVEYRTARLMQMRDGGDTASLMLSDGTPLAADAMVLACGPWLSALLPDTVGGRIRATRQEVLYFGVPAGDDRFSCTRLPVWIDFGAGLYGIPDLDAHGFKVGVDRHGPLIDPDSADRVVDPATVSATRAWLARRFPALADAPLVDARVCQYENTSSGDFIIDRHPQWSNVWIVGGGSGHGFKHGPMVGRHLADRISGRAPTEPRFALATKTVAAARAVY